ncbi:MAG: SGNH/GDSL hydrolase family protein [Blastococcus sp.]
MRRTVHALAAALLATATVTLTAGPAAAKPSPPTANGHSITTSPYVALGDSYSSAAGVLPFVPDAPAGCSRSQLNYAHDIAARTEPTSFTDVTCSGAKTSDFYTPQAVTPPDPRVGPQLDAVTRHTRLVTMTIGGNDENVFVDSFFGCPAYTASDPMGNPCEQHYGSSFTDKILTQTYPHLVAALTAVRTKAPAATVVILGYPEILPPQWIPGCADGMPYAMGDVPWLHHQQDVLNAVVRKAAQQTGARFIDMAPSSTGHDACEAPTQRWIEPAAGFVNAYPVHPNATGEAAMANQTLLQLGLLHPAGRH